MNHEYIGKKIPRKNGPEKVTGQAEYLNDIKLPGMLYARLKVSPVAHAKIIKIDISKALKLPGVKAILTGEDAHQRMGIYMVDRPILAYQKVRYYGEPIAAVAAVDTDTAEEAVSLIEFEYEELPVVQDVREAIKPGAVILHEDLGSYKWIPNVYFPEPGTNIANHFKVRKGDIEEGFKESEFILENEFDLPQVLHVPMETHGTIVRWGTNDRIKIWSSAQSPFAVRDLFSAALGVPMQNVDVTVPFVGGGFGGKSGIHFEPLIGLLSKKAKGKPVKYVASREEETATLPCRQGLAAKIKTGFNSDGKIIAEKIEYLWDGGAYADYGVNIGRASGYSGAGPYEIDNVNIDSYTIYTNHVFGTAYRGFGHAEFFWAIERQRELIAKKLGMDSYELRMKNFLKPGSRTITGELVTENTGRVDKCLEAVAKGIGWGTPKTEEEKKKEIATGKYRGKGMAVLHKAPAMPTYCATSCVIFLNEDGSIRFNVAGIDYGQGTYTVFAQIIAEKLHMPVEKIYPIDETNTSSAPYDWQTVASRMVILGGNAVIEACDDMIEQLKETGGVVLRAAKADLEVGNGTVYVRQNPQYNVPFSKLAVGYVYPDGNAIGGPIIGRGKSIAQGMTNLDQETGQGLPAFDWTYGAHAIELEVDKNTGDIEILKVVSAFDVGQVMNELLLKGQVMGGIIQGIGTGVSEALVYNSKGQLLSRNFVDYKIPTMQDLPKEIELHYIETPQLDGPFGARGCAEHPMISITPAMGNAIAQATGVEIFHLPFSADNIYRELNK